MEALRFDVTCIWSPPPFEGPPCPWWLDDGCGMPLWVPLKLVEAARAKPPPPGFTHVWPGEEGYDEATQRAIDGAVGLVEWDTRADGIVRNVHGQRAVLRHGYISDAGAYLAWVSR